MNWKRTLAYVTGSVDEEILARNDYLVAENRILRKQIQGRIRLTASEWHHLAVAYHSSDSIAELYLDGVLSGTSSLPQPLPTSAQLLIGRDSIVPQYFFNGRLDEVSIWNRALTQGEILSIKSCQLQGSDATLVAYWNFDDGSLTDLSSN